jgi:hypothetical protein
LGSNSEPRRENNGICSNRTELELHPALTA